MYAKAKNYNRRLTIAQKVKAAIVSARGDDEAAPYTSSTHVLTCGPGKAEFHATSDGVIVTRFWRGEVLSSVPFDLPEGRKLWAELTAKGWTRF